MELPLQAFLAASPILLILFLMLKLGWPASRAGSAGLLLAALLAWSVFGYGTRVYGRLGAGAATGGALLEAGFTAVTILWIIFPALCIYQLQRRTGGLDSLRGALGKLTDDPRILAILVAWFFALFMEGAAGFGTTVALAAPFLAAAGFPRAEALTLALVGHCVGVSFGAVGTPILPQVTATGFSPLEISQATAVYHVLLGWVLLAAVLILAGRAVEHPSSGVWHWGLLAFVFFGVPFFLLAWWVGPELPTLGGAILGGVLFVGGLSLGRRKGEGSPGSKDFPAGEGGLLKSASPYLVLVALVLVTRLVPDLETFLRELRLEWTVGGEFHGEMALFYHPGTLLVVAFLAGALLQQAGRRKTLAAMREAGGQLLPVTVALVAMLGLSRLMVHAEMIESLARFAAAYLGGLWPVLAPMVGALGTFVTGSATASNILFTDFQLATAENLGLPPLTMVAAQGFGAAAGNMVCPHNVIAGGATVGLVGREGEILRRTLPPFLVYCLLGGLLCLLLV